MRINILHISLLMLSRCSLGNETPLEKLEIKNSSELIIVAERWAPFIFLDVDENGKEIFSGPFFALFELCAQLMNKTYRMKRTPDLHWGVKRDDGNWTGMIGMLLREEADIAIGPFYYSPERNHVIDYIQPIMQDSQKILIKRPTLENNIFSFLLPLSLYVYIGVGVTTLLVAFALQFLNGMESRSFQVSIQGNSFINSIIWSFKVLMQEASLLPVSSNAHKILFAIWLLVSFVIMKSYEGNLTAMLTVQTVDIPIDSVDDLISQTKMPWRIITGSFMFNLLKDATDQSSKTLFSNRMQPGGPLDCLPTYEYISNGEYALVTSETNIKKCFDEDFSLHGKCNLYAAKDPVFSGLYMSGIIAKNNALIEPIRKWQQNILTAGLFDKWIKDELLNATYCQLDPSSDNTGSFKTLQLENFFGSFILLGVGLLTATLVFGLELLMQFSQHSIH